MIGDRLGQRNERRRFDAWREVHGGEIEQRLASGVSRAGSGSTFGGRSATQLQPGRLVAGIINSASSRVWADSGYGRRMVFLFEDAVLVLETNRAGKPLGIDQLELDDEAIVAMPLQARELAALDSRNVLLWVKDARLARLTGRANADSIA